MILSVGKHRILIIEDQEDLAELIKAALEGAGYEASNAYTGEEGVAEFTANGADAVLLDMTLPEMHGTQVLEELRALSPGVPVIVVTGGALEESRALCDRLGVQAYLPKPFDYDELNATLRRALAARTTDEEFSVVTVRLSARVLQILATVDLQVERAITQLCEERAQAANS